MLKYKEAVDQDRREGAKAKRACVACPLLWLAAFACKCLDIEPTTPCINTPTVAARRQLAQVRLLTAVGTTAPCKHERQTLSSVAPSGLLAANLRNHWSNPREKSKTRAWSYDHALVLCFEIKMTTHRKTHFGVLICFTICISISFVEGILISCQKGLSAII